MTMDRRRESAKERRGLTGTTGADEALEQMISGARAAAGGVEGSLALGDRVGTGSTGLAEAPGIRSVRVPTMDATGQGFQDHGPLGQPESFGPLPPVPENDTGLEDRNGESGERVSDQVATRLGSQHPLDGTTAVSERSGVSQRPLDGTAGVSQRPLDGTVGVSQHPLDGTDGVPPRALEGATEAPNRSDLAGAGMRASGNLDRSSDGAVMRASGNLDRSLDGAGMRASGNLDRSLDGALGGTNGVPDRNLDDGKTRHLSPGFAEAHGGMLGDLVGNLGGASTLGPVEPPPGLNSEPPMNPFWSPARRGYERLGHEIERRGVQCGSMDGSGTGYGPAMNVGSGDADKSGEGGSQPNTPQKDMVMDPIELFRLRCLREAEEKFLAGLKNMMC